MDVVVVESPAKAKTINKYLGSNYTVLASYGHVRDLPPKDGSVSPDDNFAMIWQVAPESEKHIDAIAKALKGAEHLYLATDPDREGEAISWHVQEELKQRDLLNGVDVSRVVFHEVTKSAVLDALQNPRELKYDLVDAYLARRALDYLVGFTLSPVLWRKLPGARSAGRVQSVALRLICEREAEIEIFKPQEYWTIDAMFQTPQGADMPARLTHLDSKRLDRFDLNSEQAAMAAVEAVGRHNFSVGSIERKLVKRRPYAPFTTSTLQQEASRKLGFGASRTMRTAQKLYEGVDIGGETVGLITYMRTDSVTLAVEAVAALRKLITGEYGPTYCPEKPNVYRTKAKNAQEAHEAIRPTDVTRRPEMLSGRLGPDELKLYDLIWKRTVASAMSEAVLEQVAVDMKSPDGAVVLRANGSMVKFDGFLRVYREGLDDDAEDGAPGDRILPPVNEGDGMKTGAVTPEQHFTKPPPRFTEASLVKRLEELGIGRPSTYASIISVLQSRNYVRLESRRFYPEDRGRLVVAFLSGFFERYVEYNFTAELEDKLDDISNGDLEWRDVLAEFWRAFSAAVEDTRHLTITNVIDALDEDLGPHFFPVTEETPTPRKCPACDDGRLGLKIGRNGGFIGCSNYPECKYTRALAVGGGADAADEALAKGPLELGSDPETNLAVTLRKGPFGPYIQLGEPEGKEKPKRASLLKDMDPLLVDLETALKLLSLPREVGAHPETGDMILAGIGRFGPYLKVGTRYVRLGPDDDLLTIGLNRAVTVIAETPQRGGRATALRTLGDHPDDGKPVEVFEGRYGPYVKHGKINATIPKDSSVEAIELDEAVALIAARAAKGGKKKAKKAKAKTQTKKKASSKAAGAKKAKSAKSAKKPAKARSSAKKKDGGTDAPDPTS